MKILFTGGGTAGHISPIIAVSREMRKIYPRETDLQFFYLGPRDKFGEILLSQEGIKVKTILAGKIRRYFGFRSLFQNIFDILFRIPIGFFQALFYVFIISPDLIFSKGGYGSASVVFSGWMLLVPIFLHESDIAPGLANRLMSRFALEIFVSFPVEKTGYFRPEKMISVGNPIRLEILEGEVAETSPHLPKRSAGREMNEVQRTPPRSFSRDSVKEEAKELFKLTPQKPAILILGGSQGSQRINDVILAILPELLTNFELIHQVGEKNFKEIESEVRVIVDRELQKSYHPFPFLQEQELKQAYIAADLVISRSGSSSIFEISAAGKPSILIPLAEAAQNHQLKNAYAYQESGACLVIEEMNFTPHFFSERIKYLFSNPEKLKKMADSAKEFAKPQAAKIIAQYIVEYLIQ